MKKNLSKKRNLLKKIGAAVSLASCLSVCGRAKAAYKSGYSVDDFTSESDGEYIDDETAGLISRCKQDPKLAVLLGLGTATGVTGVGYGGYQLYKYLKGDGKDKPDGTKQQNQNQNNAQTSQINGNAEVGTNEAANNPEVQAENEEKNNVENQVEQNGEENNAGSKQKNEIGMLQRKNQIDAAALEKTSQERNLAFLQACLADAKGAKTGKVSDKNYQEEANGILDTLRLEKLKKRKATLKNLFGGGDSWDDWVKKLTAGVNKLTEELNKKNVH